MTTRTRRNACIVAIATATACAAIALAQTALAGLGLDEARTRQDVLYALSQGNVNVYPAVKAFKAATPAVRVTLVTGVLGWVKAYTQSPAFKTEYDRQRQSNAPTPPKFKGTVDEELAAQRAEQQKGIDESRKSLAQMPADMRAQMEATIKQMEAQTAAMNKDPQMQAMLRQGIEMQRSEKQKAYERDVEAHAKRFPADPRVLVARRLQEFLDVSKDVDFAAKLVPAGTKQRFADPRYESKPGEWKLCYRAGKDVTDAARQFAQAWLAELGVK
jgi:hypothetical protein